MVPGQGFPDPDEPPGWCPGCGHDGEFRTRGQFSHNTTTIDHGDSQTHHSKWSVFECPQCGEEFARKTDERAGDIDAGPP